MRDARAAIMSDDAKAFMAKRAHDRDLIGRHGALRIVDVIRAAFGLGAVAVTAQIGGDDREAFGEIGSDFVPGEMHLRVAMKQEQWQSRSADGGSDADTVRVYVSPAKSRHEIGVACNFGHKAFSSISHGFSER